MNFLNNVKMFLRSVFGKKADFSEYVKRINACSECTWNIKKKNRNYCKECGCPKTIFWPFSELKLKCGYKNAECPRKKW